MVDDLQFAGRRALGNEQTWLKSCGLPKPGCEEPSQSDGAIEGLVESPEATELSLIPKGTLPQPPSKGPWYSQRGLCSLDSCQGQSFSLFCAKNLPPSGSSPPPFSYLPPYTGLHRPHLPPSSWDNLPQDLSGCPSPALSGEAPGGAADPRGRHAGCRPLLT